MDKDNRDMITGYSIHDVIEFYGNAMASAAIPKNTGQLKQIVLRALLEKQIVTIEEAADIRNIDIDRLGKRMTSCFPGVSNATLKVYTARVKRSIREFRSWKCDGGNFQFKRRKAKTPKKKSDHYHCCCPIRGGKIVLQLDNIPRDLTKEEAEQVSSVMRVLLRTNTTNNDKSLSHRIILP